MAPSHVPSDHLPPQGQSSIYTDPSYDNLFPRVEQYGTPSWDQFHPHHSSISSGTPQSWHQTSLPQPSYNSIPHSYGPASQPYSQTQTASPYPYAQFNSHGSLNNYGHQPQQRPTQQQPPAQQPQQPVDPALSVDPIAMRQQQQSPYQIIRNTTPQAQPTVTPQALQQTASVPNARPPTASAFQVPKSTTEIFSQRASPAALPVQPVSNPKYELPLGKVSAGFVVLDQAALAKATKSTAFNKLVNIGSEPLHLAVNRTALPVYNSRQSLKDLRKVAAGNKSFLDKLGKRPSASKLSTSKILATGKHGIGSPSSLKRDVSDSDSYESSDESDYTSDEDEEPSPLPASRPEEPHAAVRYDVMKATWYPRKSQPSSQKIKTSLKNFWEILNTIQKRWRADSKAVSEAEEQKKTGELPVLKSRVTSQRDLLQSALKTALDFAHLDVLYYMGQVKSFLYLCYQFLANRFKMQDYNGGLSTVIYEILARCAGTLTNELLEETKVIKALNSMKKNATDSNKAVIQQVIEAAAAGSKKPKPNSPPQYESEDQKNGKRTAAQATLRATAETTPTKKVKASEPIVGATRKIATAAPTPKIIAPAANAASQKRPGEKLGTAPAKARGHQVVNKPSTFFSTLNAASKKPAAAPISSTASKPIAQQKNTIPAGKDKKATPTVPSKPAFSFAETMAQLLTPKEEPVAPPKPEKKLPPETPEEKARRLRKESRRHLRVSFRPDATLTSIRYFNHDPDEELGHEENFVRDAGDIGGEGRMFKQHKDMDDDEDDDELELSYREWTAPSNIDFSVIDQEERKRNYEPYGGGESKPHCPEKEANQRRENSTLMVFYSHSSDIPSSPREPLESQTQEPVVAKEFGIPAQFVLDRSPKPPASATVPDFSQLESFVRSFASATTNPPQHAATQSAYVPPQPAVAPLPDLSAILSALQAPTHPQPQIQAQSLAQTLSQIPAPAAQPTPGFDLATFLSTIQGSATGTTFPQAPTWPSMVQPFQQPQQASQQNQLVNGGAKRQREDNISNSERSYGSFKKQKGGKPHSNHGDNKPHKVIPCRFFQQGKCTKGDDCTFIHDRNM